MRFQLYRHTTIGTTLQETLYDLIKQGKLSSYMGTVAFRVFDEIIEKVLSTQANAHINIDAKKLECFRFCDGVWTLVLKDVTIYEYREVIFTNCLKIVACNAKHIN